MGSAEAKIRAYQSCDEAAVIGLVRELQRHEGTIFDRMKPPGEIGSWYIEALLEECGKTGGEIFVAELAGDLLGYAAVLARQKVQEPDEVSYEVAYVLDLFVSAAARGKGLGKHLLQACEQRARKQGAKWLRISVLAGNQRAIDVYHAFGFEDHLLELEMRLGGR